MSSVTEVNELPAMLGCVNNDGAGMDIGSILRLMVKGVKKVRLQMTNHYSKKIRPLLL
jgi:hypothetical protein